MLGMESTIIKLNVIFLFIIQMQLNTLNLNQENLFVFYSTLFENDFILFLPELFLIFSVFYLLLFGVVYTTSKKQNYVILLNCISLLTILTLFLVMILLKNNFITNGIIFYNSLYLDYFTYYLKNFIVLTVIFSLIISLNYNKKNQFNNFEYNILILLSTISMLLLTSCFDFISMYLAIEFQSLCFYVMAASKRNSFFSTEAGLKYFLLGAFSSGIILFGISFIYGFTGITNFTELSKIFFFFDTFNDNFMNNKACILGMVFILVGFLFKLTAVPFHMWSPDVYEGSPTYVTAFFSLSPKISILAILIKVFYLSFYDLFDSWQKILIFSSLLSMIVAVFNAMAQNKIKRLLAFSSIANVGYLLIGICCGTTQGLQALFIYLFFYLVMTINIFAIILSPFKYKNNVFLHKTNQIKYTYDLVMLAKTNPILAFTFTIVMFSIAGIPPLAGFYSKAFLFFTAMSSTMYLLSIVGVLTSVCSCFYYIRLVKIMYFDKPKNWFTFEKVKKENSIVLAITLFSILFFGIYPTPLYLMSHKFALCILC